MNLFLKYLVFPVFLFLLANNTFGQIAAFTQDTLEGCEQQTVNFTNLSTGATSYIWRFGDGNTSNSSSPNVTEIYANVGTYTVTLVAINGSLRDSISKVIHIWRNPNAIFNGTPPFQGCVPLSVNFSDISIAGDGAINTWTWDFGDGNGANIQNPTHIFSTPGSWSIYLKVEDSHHCSDWDTLNNYVNVSNPPDVAFTANSTVNCTVPFPVTFTNSTTGTGPMTYAWDFGDGGNSTSQSPNHTYTVAGTYTVKLTVTDKWGCADSLIKTNYISITPVSAAFNFAPSDSACIGQVVNFFNESGTNVLWAFGEPSSGSANVSTLSNPTHTYLLPGPHIITLTAAPGTLCQSIIKDTIIIRNPPTVVFSISPTPHYVCSSTTPVTFTDNSPDAVSWSWNLGNGNTSTSQNPSATYSNEGSYTATLTITDSHGCSGTYTNPSPIIVDFPTATITWDSDSLPNHCIPFPVDFTGSGSYNLIYDSIPVTGWNWNFGDGTTSTLQNPNHIYTTPGEYNITLTITTANGCPATTTITIKVGAHQIPIIQNTFSLGCANETSVHFVSLSTDSNLIDFWDWSFIANLPDSNYTVATSSEQHPTVDFHGLDSISIQLIVGYLECKDTIVDTNAFYLKGPFLKNISTIFSCATPLHLGLTYEYIKKANRWYWDFNGDGTYEDSSIFATPVYSYHDTVWYDYPSRGTYMIHLKAFNDITGCFYEDSIQYRIYVIDAVISAPTPHCYNSNVITLTNSLDWNHPGPAPQNADYTVNYGDGQTIAYTTFNQSNQVYLHNYPMVNGSYNVILTMHNFLGCIDSDTTTIRIYYPVAGYTMTPDSGCAPLTVSFTDTSHSQIPYTLTWHISGATSPIFTPPDTTYNSSGIFHPYLHLVDSIGCVSNFSVPTVYVLNLPPNFSAIDSTICLGDSIHFISNVLFSNSYNWDFGDSNTEIGLNPSHLYADTGTYTVSLLTQSSLPGCDGTEVKPSFIHVQDILANIKVIDSVSTCYPFSINITNLTNTLFSPVWDWSFGDGSTGNQFQPIHTYTLPGDYWLNLTATTTPQNLYGCSSKDSIPIHIGGPYSEISYSDNTICKGESITFALVNNIGVTSFNWSFGDGGGGTTTPFTYQFNYVPPSGLTKVYLIYQSDINCQKKDSVYINIYQVMANYNYLNSITGNNDSVICQPGLLDFYNYSIGADSMIWNFGDGQTFTSTDSSIVPGTHTFYNQTNNNINYNITLTVFNSAVGCIDSITKHYLVYPLPQINVGNDIAICAGSTVQLNATGGNVISWTPSNSLSNPTVYTPFATPDSSVLYQALIHDAHGCSNTDSVYVFVQQVPELNHNPDTTIIIGEFVDMMANSDQTTVTYNWTPSYGLSCTTCPNPIAQPLTTTTYTVEIIDSMTCFHVTGQVTIEVKEEYSIDVPSAFTPNGDGDNDLVFVRGWGIKQLLEFKIYNRWGECIFETDDIHVGWDGTFKGTKQNIDTYAYTAKVSTYSGKVLTKNGLINLLR